MTDSEQAAESIASDSRSPSRGTSPDARSVALGGATDVSFIQNADEGDADLDYSGVQEHAASSSNGALARGRRQGAQRSCTNPSAVLHRPLTSHGAGPC